MEKRGLASRIMRIVSVVGIICLLVLQWIWWRNAYRAVEMDFMKSTQVCIGEAFDKSFTLTMDGKSKEVRVMRESDIKKNNIKLHQPKTKHSANSTSEISYLIEELLVMENKALTEEFVGVQLKECLKERFGDTVSYEMKFHRLTNVIDSVDKPNYNRIAIGNGRDTIYHQFGFMSYATVIIPSPIKLYLKKGALILLVSILLVLLVGSILIIQSINMRRDRKFADFIIDYTRMITHDLRTPVTSIMMIFNVFKNELVGLSKKHELYLNDGITLSKKILHNYDKILYVAKSEQKELLVHRSKVEIRSFMEKVVNAYRARDFNPKKVTIATWYEPASFSCNMDVELMENVMCNLLDNAIKYTGNESIIHVSCKYENDLVEISVRDNGIGMSDEDLKRVFDLFERGSTNEKNIFPGFGIGLHFVRLVVKGHGGKITVKSSIDKGTEFTIKFIS